MSEFSLIIEATAFNSVSTDLESRISILEKQVAELTALLQKGVDSQ